MIEFVAFIGGIAIGFVLRHVTITKPAPVQPRVRLLAQYGPHVLLDLGNDMIIWRDITKGQRAEQIRPPTPQPPDRYSLTSTSIK